MDFNSYLVLAAIFDIAHVIRLDDSIFQFQSG
jgi:hypothetical protein